MTAKKNLSYWDTASKEFVNGANKVFKDFFANDVISIGSLLRKVPYLPIHLIKNTGVNSIFIEVTTPASDWVFTQIGTKSPGNPDDYLATITHRCKSASSLRSLDRVINEFFGGDKWCCIPHVKFEGRLHVTNQSYWYSKIRIHPEETVRRLLRIEVDKMPQSWFQRTLDFFGIGSYSVHMTDTEFEPDLSRPDDTINRFIGRSL